MKYQFVPLNGFNQLLRGILPQGVLKGLYIGLSSC